MAEKLGNSVKQALFFGAVLGLISLTWLCSCNPSPSGMGVAEAADSGQFDETNPLGANAACYVCHMTFVGEELSKMHLLAKIACVECHGVSAAHANDENIGATPPDITFDREEVDAMCLKCHERHDISAQEIAVHKHPSVCTDCHGSHRIIQTSAASERSVTCRRYKDEVMTSRL